MSKKDWSIAARAAFLYSQHLDGFIPALADWVECQALLRVNVGCDKTTLISALGIDNWAPPTDDLPFTNDTIGDLVFEELAERSDNYGNRGYPFVCDRAGRQVKFSSARPWPYLFLLGLSYANPADKPKKAGIPTGGFILEALAWTGLQRFIGEPPKDLVDFATCHHLGRPSLSNLPGRFDEKVNYIANQFREGKRYCPQASGHRQSSGDNGVDVLLRRGFPDDRGAQFLFFGACAAGKDWSSTKRYECNPPNWLDRNFEADFHGTSGMARCFVVPRQLPQDGWRETARAAGMLIDRCRLSLITCGSGSPHLDDARAWTEAIYGRAF